MVFGQVKRIEHYYYVFVRGDDGIVDEWLLTANEIERIRERSIRKSPVLPGVKDMPKWKKTLLRWLDVL